MPTRTLATGTTIQGQVVVTNATGAEITAGGCGSLFAVALVSPSYTPNIVWPTCGQQLTIPVGASSYPVTISASWSDCTNDPPPVATLPGITLQQCVDGHPPDLPPGPYEAHLFQVTHVVPDADPVPVLVQPK
jgi:hypothetical protein